MANRGFIEGLKAFLTTFGVRETLDRDLVPVPECSHEFDLAKASPDATYAWFEGLFRGDQATIASRQQRYLPWIQRASAATQGLPIIDAGCGRGETLQLCRDNGIEARGVDLNKLFCSYLEERGLDVVCGDAVDYLSSLEPESIGGLVSNSVIEHLQPAQAERLLSAAARAIAPGGCLVIETNNCESPYANGQFWLDMTHVRPYHAQTLMFYACGLGFTDVMTQYRTPNPWRHRQPLGRAENYQEIIVVGFKPLAEEGR